MKPDNKKIIRECQWAADKISDNGFITMTSAKFFKDVIQLLQGSNPKAPNILHSVTGIYATCPVCGNVVKPILTTDQISLSNPPPKYCDMCGQQLIWGDEKDEAH